MQIDPHDLSTGELSSVFRVTRPAVTGWVKAGCPHANARFNLANVIQWRLRQDQTEDVSERVKRLQGDKLELDLSVRRGELIDREEAVRTFRRHITDAKTILNGLPASLGLLVPEFDTKIQQEASEVVDHAMRAISKGVEVIQDSKVEGEEDDIA